MDILNIFHYDRNIFSAYKMNDLVTSPEDPTVKYKEDAHCTRSTSFTIVLVSKLTIHDRNRFERAVNYLMHNKSIQGLSRLRKLG